ncbi:hypothetical protein Glove_26g179 [Diversispora epigaea]|uniref:Crinkler effector protein N-terminal domain-containing protein n=1 Tax=Diversispora epigaea TaxID=1348612 RepID=A0A397JS40_9GLOM|nr:hypothetical protein Glove_26g179 [Diversispora epigaea]
MSIKLFCLIKGDSIECQTFDNIDTRNLKLKKVNIKINYNITTIHESELRNGIQLYATDNIEKYWTEILQKKHIHVFIKLSPTENIEEILNPYIINKPQDLFHKSILKLNNIPDGISNISTYLKFVGREEEVKQLMKNIENLYFFINELKPIKEIEFSTIVGTAGKGKTIFVQRAYENLKIYNKIIKPEVVQIKKNYESSFGKILLYEVLKYQLPNNINSLKFGEMFGDKFNFEEIFDLILFYIPCLNKKIKTPLIIINIDKINVLFESNNSIWLKMVLRSLARVISKGYFLFIVLSRTHANTLFNIIKSKVILELTNWKVVNETERINEFSEHLKYIIELLDVVGRFLEVIIFQMNIISTNISNNLTVFNNTFYQSRLRYFLQKCQYESKHCQKLLERTKMFITIYQKSIADKVIDPYSCQLSQLRQFVENNKQSTQYIAYYNLQNDKFADSFLLTDPPILIQDKQLVTNHKKVIDNYSSIILDKDLVKYEYNKYKNIGDYIFLFITDSKKRDDETYKIDEILITEEKKKIYWRFIST